MTLFKVSLSLLLLISTQVSLAQKTSEKLSQMIQSIPYIADTSLLINSLIKEYNLEADSLAPRFASTIDRFEKIPLYGNDKDLILIEYNVHDGPMALHPYKYQLLFDANGELIDFFMGERLELLRLNKGEVPYLFVLNTTARGNGAHELYRIHNSKLINVFGGFSDYFPKTYDAHDDFGWNEPHELKLSLKDDNHDGRMDLVFSGTIVAYNHPKIPVEFIFLATQRDEIEWFIQKENYSEKYAYLTKGN